MPFSSSAVVLAASTGGGGGGGTSFIFLILILVVGYLLLVRPARRRQRQAMESRSGVAPGVEVTTTAGLIATVIDVDDTTVTLEVAPGVHSRYLKGAVARVNTPVDADEGAHEQIDPDEHSSTQPDGTESPDADPNDR